MPKNKSGQDVKKYMPISPGQGSYTGSGMTLSEMIMDANGAIPEADIGVVNATSVVTTNLQTSTLITVGNVIQIQSNQLTWQSGAPTTGTLVSRRRVLQHWSNC